MKVTSKAAIAAALVAGTVGGAVAIAPTYAQEPATAAPIETAQFEARMGFGGAFGAGIEIGRPAVGPLGGELGENVLRMIAHAEDLLAEFDANGDGVVTQAEIDTARAAELAAYDADGDGALTLEEYQAYWLSRFFEQMVDAFQHLDANGDGKVTTEEFNAGVANIVARLDQNGDGALGADDRPERTATPDERRGAIIIGPRR